MNIYFIWCFLQTQGRPRVFTVNAIVIIFSADKNLRMWPKHLNLVYCTTLPALLVTPLDIIADAGCRVFSGCFVENLDTHFYSNTVLHFIGLFGFATFLFTRYLARHVAPPPDHYLHDALKYKTTPEKPFTFSACFGLPGSSLFTHTDGRGGGGGAVGTCSAPEDCFNFFSCRR